MLALLRSWAAAMTAEIGLTAGRDDLVGLRIAAGNLLVWEDSERIVSMAAVTAAQSGVSRVQLVFTPPELRRRGYASACVAALTAAELAVPGRRCMLYADLANPTSNTVYQSTGYRRVGVTVDLLFQAGTEIRRDQASREC